MTQSSTRKRRLVLMSALGVLAVAVAMLSYGGIEKNLVYYLSPEELLAKKEAAYGATVRLGGVVQKGSVQWNNKTMDLTFAVGMSEAGEPKVLITTRGAPPQMFQEGIGAVVEGTFDGQMFHGDRVMVKHSNEYRPPSPEDSAASTFSTLDAPDPKPLK